MKLPVKNENLVRTLKNRATKKTLKKKTCKKIILQVHFNLEIQQVELEQKQNPRTAEKTDSSADFKERFCEGVETTLDYIPWMLVVLVNMVLYSK